MSVLVAIGLSRDTRSRSEDPTDTPRLPLRLRTERELESTASEQPPVPSLIQAVYLVRSTLLTLNDANRSGNYTVLRDIASPAFASRNSAADLAGIFTDLRRRKFDLFAVATLAPEFEALPSVDAMRHLHLVGRFRTLPLEIAFDLQFEVIQGDWRLFAISIATPQAQGAVANQIREVQK